VRLRTSNLFACNPGGTIRDSSPTCLREVFPSSLDFGSYHLGRSARHRFRPGPACCARKYSSPFSIYFPFKGSSSLNKCHRSSDIGRLYRTLPRFRCRFDSDRPLHNFQQVTPLRRFPYFPIEPIWPLWNTPPRRFRQEFFQNRASSSQPSYGPSAGG